MSLLVLLASAKVFAQQEFIEACSLCTAGQVCHTLRENNVLQYELQCKQNDATSCRHKIDSTPLSGCPLSHFCDDSVFNSAPNIWDCEPYVSWASWTSWSLCSVTCGSGTQRRTRACQNGAAGQDGCSGGVEETKPCTPPCDFPVETCQEWSAWTVCQDSSCTANEKERCRDCTSRKQCENNNGDDTTTTKKTTTTAAGENNPTTTTTTIETTTTTTATATASCPVGQILNESSGNCDLTRGSIAAIAVVLSLLALSVISILICFLCGCCGCTAKPCTAC